MFVTDLSEPPPSAWDRYWGDRTQLRARRRDAQRRERMQCLSTSRLHKNKRCGRCGAGCKLMRPRFRAPDGRIIIGKGRCLLVCPRWAACEKEHKLRRMRELARKASQ